MKKTSAVAVLILCFNLFTGIKAFAAFSSSDPTLIVSNVVTPEANQAVCSFSQTSNNIHMQGVISNTGLTSRSVQVFYKTACLGTAGGANPSYSNSAGWGEIMTIPAQSSVPVSSGNGINNIDMDCRVSVCVGVYDGSNPFSVESYPCESDGLVFMRAPRLDGSCLNVLSPPAGKIRGKKR